MSIGSVEDLKKWEAEFEAARRRPLKIRMRYSFIRTYKQVLDDAPYRSFETTAQYREWCDEHLPSWLGYGREVFGLDCGILSADGRRATARRTTTTSVNAIGEC